MTAPTIIQSFIDQFSPDLRILAEQKGSHLRPLVKVEIAKGEKHFFDRLGGFTATEVTGRAQPTELQDAAHSRRMATVRKYAANTSLDDIDKLKMLIDPTSEYAQGLARAQGRQLDVVIANAALGTAATGRDGTGTAAFDSAQQIAHGSAGLTVAKLNTALRIFENNEIDTTSTKLFLVANALAVEDLYGDSSNQLTSFDFQGSRFPVATGAMPSFRGVNIIKSNIVPAHTAGSVYRALLMSEGAVKVAMSEDLRVEVDRRPDLNYLLQIATYMQYGAVRMEENAVVDILFQ